MAKTVRTRRKPTEVQYTWY